MTRRLRNAPTVRAALAVVGAIGVLLIAGFLFLKLSVSCAGTSYTVYDGYRFSVRASDGNLIDLPVKPFERTVRQCQLRLDDAIDVLQGHGFTRIAVVPDLSPASYEDAYKTYRGETYCFERRLSSSWPVYVSITDCLPGEGYAIWFFYQLEGWTWGLAHNSEEADALGNSLAADLAFRLMGWKTETASGRSQPTDGSGRGDAE